MYAKVRIGLSVLLGLIFLLGATPPLRADSAEVVSGSAEVPGTYIAIRPLPEVTVYFRGLAASGGIITAVREIAHQQFPHIDLGTPSYIYRLATTAQANNSIVVCISFDPAQFASPPGTAMLYQIDGTEAVYRTRGYTWTQACGDVGYLSSFAIAEPFGIPGIQFSRVDTGNAGIDAETTPTMQNGATPRGREYGFYSAGGQAELIIANGAIPATGAHVVLNGALVGPGSLFKKYENNLTAPAVLLPGYNVLEVFVDGPPGSGFMLSIQRPS